LFPFGALLRMPRYFFHVHHERPSYDQSEEFADRQAAWHDAVVSTGRSLIDLGGRFLPGRTWRLEVADEFEDIRHPCEDGEQAIMRAHEPTPTVPEMAAPPIEPPEIQPPTPSNPTEPPPEEPPGNPRPEVPPPVREPSEPAPPDNLPGRTPDEFPVRGPNNPTTPNPAIS
jgi:hypothetical protein